jgi:hypothetical protein
VINTDCINFQSTASIVAQALPLKNKNVKRY